MSLATLHGRPVKAGDRVFYLPARQWYAVAGCGNFIPWVTIHAVLEQPDQFAWDEPPLVDITKLVPPLAFTHDGCPIRVDSIVYCNTLEAAVEAVRTSDFFKNTMIVRTPVTGNKVRVPIESLSYDFPDTPPAPKQVVQEKTRWFNIYPNDAGRHSYQTFGSEEKAKKYARPGCQGQGYFTYRFTGPVQPL